MRKERVLNMSQGPYQKTFVDKIDDWLLTLSPQSLRFLSASLVVAAFVLLVEGTNFNMSLIGLILFIVLLRISSYVKKVQKRRRRNNPPVPDYIDVVVTEHKEAAKPMPEIPQPSAIHPAYTRTLDELKSLADQLDRQFGQLDAFLDDFFGDSTISKNKYLSQVDLARKSAFNNLQKAENAVNLFGDSKPPTARRQEILNQYVESSRKTVEDVDAIIDELLRVDQSNTELTYEFLDENLDTLKRVTKQYEKTA